jgi:hypothetical protein
MTEPGPMTGWPATDCPCRCHRVPNPEDYLCRCRSCWDSESDSNEIVGADEGMTHDPLCAWRRADETDTVETYFGAGFAVCDCEFIARIREDQDKRWNHSMARGIRAVLDWSRSQT